MTVADPDIWWNLLGEYVERHIGKIEWTSDTIVGDMPQILYVRPRSAPEKRLLVSQVTALGQHPRELCIEIAADSVEDEGLVTGLATNLRMFADYARDSAKAFKLGDTIAFDDPSAPLWDGSTYVGFCLASGAIDGSVGDLRIDGIGEVPLLLPVPIFADEMTKFGRGQALREAILARGIEHDTRQTRKSLAKWDLS